MRSILRQTILLVVLSLLVACSSGENIPPVSETVSMNTALFDPSTGVVPLPNILATATAADPLTGRNAGKPMNPAEALSYVNRHEVGETNAVAGVTAPIYIRFAAPVDPSTVNSATVKVFQIGVDANGVTETSPLSFTDVSALFDYRYTAGRTDLHLFPKFPLLPGTRYLYVVTTGVKDAATGGAVAGSFYFEALKSTSPLTGPFAALEAIRANVYADPEKQIVKLSGYGKVMDDLIAASSTTKITDRSQIALLGRFITTAASVIPTDLTNGSSRIPVETALRMFAARGLSGGFPGTPFGSGSGPTPVPKDTWWSAVMGSTTSAPSTVGAVYTGTIRSALLSVDPVVVAASGGPADMTGISGALNPAAGVLQGYRPDGKTLAGFYHLPAEVPYVYIAPSGAAPPKGWPLVIFQHGITGQKEQVIALAETLTKGGFAVIAIDLPLHGELQIPAHTSSTQWGEDFMAVGAPLATRTNIQQAAFNLHRLELSLKTGMLASLAEHPDTSQTKFVALSLGSIVGTYYLAGATSLSQTGIPYTQQSLDIDMKGFLSVPGARLAYLLQQSPTFSTSIDQGLSAVGIAPGSPAYHSFFQATQSILDAVDPAAMTTPLAAGLPSRLSRRLVMQEAVGDLVIPNESTRYLGSSLGGREVLGESGAAVAPGFRQLGYLGDTTPRVPAPFLYTLVAGAPSPKVGFAAFLLGSDTTPTEGYFQFDLPGVTHGFLINPADSTITLGQTQMLQWLLRGVVVDPTPPTIAKSLAKGVTAPPFRIHTPATFTILTH